MTLITSRHARRLSIVLVTALFLSVLSPACFAQADVKNQQIVVSDITDRLGSINITAGKAEGIVEGSKGIILRDGKKIADYEVVQVNWGFSRIAVSNLAEGYTVQVGDSAPITSVASPPARAKKKPSWLKYVWYAVGAGALIYLISRSDSGSPAPAVTIDLKAEKTTEFDDTDTSTITITATIKDTNGNYVPDGTEVTFTTTSGSLSLTRTTTTLGKATVVLTGEVTEPPAVVTVKARGKTATLSVSFGASVQLQAEPNRIQIVNSGGAQTESKITATCTDAQGNPAAAGTVKFTTTLGTITDSVDIVNGVATATLTSTAAGKATINATWAGTTASTTVTITAGPPRSVTVTSSASSIRCDGHSSATITATVKDIGGNPATDGTIVRFSVVPDAAGGGNGTITPQAITSGGEARATLLTKDSTGAVSKSGIATVKVEVLVADQPADIPAPPNDLVNQSTQVRFISTEVAHIGLSANPRNIRGWDMNTEKSTITAVVKNADNAPVPDGTVVTWTATHGMITPTSTTTDGIATATLQADASGNSSWNGLVDVTATAGGVSVTSPGLVVFSGWPSPPRCTANIQPSTLPKTYGTAHISVQALDVNGNPVVDNTRVTAETTKGTLSPTSGNTSAGAVIFTLNTSTDTGNPTPTGDGTVTIRISSGGNNPETGGLDVTLTVNFTVVD